MNKDIVIVVDGEKIDGTVLKHLRRLDFDGRITHTFEVEEIVYPLSQSQDQLDANLAIPDPDPESIQNIPSPACNCLDIFRGHSQGCSYYKP